MSHWLCWFPWRAAACALVVGTTLAVLLPAALAEPYLAQREGYKCGKCHVNRTGGGKRTAFGYGYGLTHLAFGDSAPVKGEEGGAGQGAIDPFLNDHVSVGANLRLANITALADEIHNTFDSREANFYVDLEASGARVYADLSLANGSVEGREVFGLFALPSGLSLKAGYFLLPYGLRIWGDDEFVRSETGYNYATPDIGAELGFEQGPFSAFVAVSNGSGGSLDADPDKKISTLLELAWRPMRVGLSGSYNPTRTRINTMGGGFVGTTLGRLTLLAEVDILHLKLLEANDEITTLVAYGEADLLIGRGVNLELTYGYHDPALDVDEDQRMTASAAIELFPVSGVATTLSYHLKQSVPQDEVGNADVVLVELHLFL